MTNEIKNILENLAHQLGLNFPNDTTNLNDSTEYKTINITFSQKEIKQMPEQFRKKYLVNGLIVSCRKRSRGSKLSSCSYELRFRKDGYDISASGTTIENAKMNFIKKIKDFSSDSTYPTLFTDFCIYYIENYQKKKVCEKVYKVNLSRVKTDFKKAFKNKRLKDITPANCQKLIDETIALGYGRKAEDIKGLLNQVFSYAKKLDLIRINPIDLIVYFKHEREHGKALTKDEELYLLTKTEGTPYQVQFAVALYTGLRPNEYSSAKIEDGFIVAINSKRKNSKIEYKKIPITPMLKPYLATVTEFKFYYYETILEYFKRLLPNHRLYDLRTTFFNRCIECKVMDVVRDEWMGHKSNNIMQAYTDLSDAILLSEGEKFKYDLN